MPKVGSKKFPYTKKGEMAAEVEAKRTGKKLEVKASMKKKAKK